MENVINVYGSVIKSTTEDHIAALVEKYVNEETYTQEELDNFYYIDEETKRYVACFNEDGFCWMHEYLTKEDFIEDECYA